LGSVQSLFTTTDAAPSASIGSRFYVGLCNDTTMQNDQILTARDTIVDSVTSRILPPQKRVAKMKGQDTMKGILIALTISILIWVVIAIAYSGLLF